MEITIKSLKILKVNKKLNKDKLEYNIIFKNSEEFMQFRQYILHEN